MKLVPTAHETVYVGWKTIGYSATGSVKDAFCGIDPHKTRINLVFHQGSQLPDPAGLLEGTGKSMRHIKIDNPQRLNSRAVKALIKIAAQFRLEK